MRKAILLALALFALSLVPTGENFANNKGKRTTKLTVLLYPWVPNYKHIAATVKTTFEKQNPGIQLVISKQNWGYYKPKGLDKKYDIYELDTIFLAQFVKQGRLQPLNPKHYPHLQAAFPFARTGSTYGGKLYGSPHWVCALFLFYHKHDGILQKNATTLGGLHNVIRPRHPQNQGLFVDFKGTFTLGEIYIDCLFDLGFTPQQVLAELNKDRLHSQALQNIRKLLQLCNIDKVRNERLHDAWPPYYPKAFAHGRARAMVGYSERLYHILGEIQKPTDFTPVINPASLTARLFNQGSGKPRAFAWIDSFCIDKSVKGRKLKAAKKFLQFMAENKVYLQTLLPPKSPPQYLLPAYPSTYQHPQLLKRAPLYPAFLKALSKKGVFTLTGENLYQLIRRAGQRLDRALPQSTRSRY